MYFEFQSVGVAHLPYPEVELFYGPRKDYLCWLGIESIKPVRHRYLFGLPPLDDIQKQDAQAFRCTIGYGHLVGAGLRRFELTLGPFSLRQAEELEPLFRSQSGTLRITFEPEIPSAEIDSNHEWVAEEHDLEVEADRVAEEETELPYIGLVKVELIDLFESRVVVDALGCVIGNPTLGQPLYHALGDLRCDTALSEEDRIQRLTDFLLTNQHVLPDPLGREKGGPHLRTALPHLPEMVCVASDVRLDSREQATGSKKPHWSKAGESARNIETTLNKQGKDVLLRTKAEVAQIKRIVGEGPKALAESELDYANNPKAYASVVNNLAGKDYELEVQSKAVEGHFFYDARQSELRPVSGDETKLELAIAIKGSTHVFEMRLVKVVIEDVNLDEAETYMENLRTKNRTLYLRIVCDRRNTAAQAEWKVTGCRWSRTDDLRPAHGLLMATYEY